MKGPEPIFDTIKIPDLHIKNFWFDCEVELWIIPVDIDTHRGTKWERENRVGNMVIDSVYDEDLEKEVEITEDFYDLIREYFRNDYIYEK